MSISEPDIIDLVSKSDDGKVTLSLVDHLPWDDEAEHLSRLKDKLNRYLDFINCGELANKFPDIADHRPLIRVHFVHAPTPTADRFLVLASQSIEADGVDFTYGLLPSKSDEIV